MSKTMPEELANLNEDFVMQQIEQRLDKGEEPMVLVRELQEGMNIVGERFKRREYFLSELIMTNELFSQAMKLIEPRLEGGPVPQALGTIVIGTPQGDIHDIGKNIFCVLARAAGFEVHDLGVDVPPQAFLHKLKETDANILGMSALITPSFEPMRQTVDSLLASGLRERVKVIIGGGVITRKVREYVGADAQTMDAVEGLDLCKRFVGC